MILMARWVRTGILFGTERKTALLSGVYVGMATLLWAQVY
jgi:hypothetical protein